MSTGTAYNPEPPAPAQPAEIPVRVSGGKKLASQREAALRVHQEKSHEHAASREAVKYSGFPRGRAAAGTASPTPTPAHEPERRPPAADEAPTLERIEPPRPRLSKIERKVLKIQQQSEAERAQFERERAHRAAEERADAWLKANNRTAWLEKHGFDFMEVAKRAVETPAQKAARLEKEREKERADRIEHELAELKADRAARADREIVGTANQQAAREFEASKARYPTLARCYTAAEIAQAVTDVRVKFYEQNKSRLSIAGALRFIEANARAHDERFNKPDSPPRPPAPKRPPPRARTPQKPKARDAHDRRQRAIKIAAGRFGG